MPCPELNSGASWRTIEEADNLLLSWSTYCRTCGKRWAYLKDLSLLLVAWHEQLDQELCQRLCDLSTKQEPHTLMKNTIILYSSPLRSTPLQSDHNGPDHPTAKLWGQRRNPHYHRSRVYLSSHLSTLLHIYNRRSHITVYGKHLPMVWVAYQGYIGQRPPLHLPLRPSTLRQTAG